MTIVETRAVTGGVDTHLDVHVAAALDGIGGLLGVESFRTTPAGYAALTSWLCGFGTLERVGIEGTGSYGAGLARHLAALGIPVLRSTGLIVRPAACPASPTRSTPSPPLERSSRAGPGASRRDAMGRSKRSGR